MLFTNRSKAAEGLVLNAECISLHHVNCLSDEDAARLLQAKVHLNDDQLRKALKVCAGLPLALKLLQGALHGALPAGGNFDLIWQRLDGSGSISCDSYDKLWQRLDFSVKCLSEELQAAWLDLVQLFAFRSDVHKRTSLRATSDLLGAFGGEHNLQELQQRNLVVILGVGHVEVVVHDVLLRMADQMCGPDSIHYHDQSDIFTVSRRVNPQSSLRKVGRAKYMGLSQCVAALLQASMQCNLTRRLFQLYRVAFTAKCTAWR